ncbi:MAG TPA: SRPBCC domain-containing protein [Microbacterium sp.]|uniref:SRPBCC domain-containing protein n=1 Tax=Microbacterium sp. TaxID=51671 RepID=UPI002B477239|nr:SRPBCC domain-containing protein [Microbacterium sp.]HKT57163.1 SRPBCC domain-containing protein [Microbacterium sp.]
MTMNATMRALDTTTGAIRVEDVYDTGIHDLWDACTTPARLARWIAQVTGDLTVGGTIAATFTSTWTGSGRVDVCEAPHHLLLTMEVGTDDEGQIEAWLSPEGDRTRLVVEERGLPLTQLYFHAAGWQTHLEDLQRSLALGASAHPDGWSSAEPSPAWRERWVELTPSYEAAVIAPAG